MLIIRNIDSNPEVNNYNESHPNQQLGGKWRYNTIIMKSTEGIKNAITATGLKYMTQHSPIKENRKEVCVSNGREGQGERGAGRSKQMLQNKSPKMQHQRPLWVMVMVLARLERTRHPVSSPQHPSLQAPQPPTPPSTTLPCSCCC